MTDSARKGRGMAALAGTLNSRADSLAARSTADEIAPSPPSKVSDPPSALATAGDEVNVGHRGPRLVEGSSGAVAAPAASATAFRRRSTRGTRLEPVRPMSGPEGRLEASGERVVKWTLELAPQLIRALAVWERDETKRLGVRVFRERMVDLALDSLPGDLSGILDVVGELPTELRHAPGDQFGTRVRASVRDKLIGLRPELRVAGIKDVRIRDIYSAGVYRYLVALDVPVDLEMLNPRNRETEKPR